jgi:hypothetical protein
MNYNHTEDKITFKKTISDINSNSFHNLLNDNDYLFGIDVKIL